MSDLMPFVVAGLGTGSILAVAAMGLVLTYRTAGIFNFAHGAVAAVGAYVMWDLWVRRGWPWPLAVLASLVLVGAAGGLALERLAYALADKSTAHRVVATVGLLVGLQGLMVLRYGQAPIPMRYFLPGDVVRIFGVNIRYEQIIVFGLALATALGLSRFLRSARIGVAMQGVIDDPSLLALQGTSPIAVRRSAWIIGSCFATLSGALMAPTLGLDATLLTLLVVQAFGAAAIGRFASLPLTYVGGLVVGLGQEIMKHVVAQDWLTDHVRGNILQPIPSNVPFLVLFGLLLLAPGSQFVERGTRTVRRQAPPAPWPRPVLIGGAAAGLAALVAVPSVVETRLPIYTTALGFTIIFASLHLLVRTSGQVSLCHMAFAAVGAATYLHTVDAGWPYPLAVLAAGAVSVPVGAFIAIPAIRLSGVYLAVATFGFGILVERIAFGTYLMFGQALQAPAPRPSFAEGDRSYYFLALTIAVACCLAVVAVRRSRLGRLLRGLAESPAALAAHGGSTSMVRTMAFCLSAFLAGVGGAVIGPVTGSATSGTFNFGVSLILIAVLFLFGRRPVLSAFLAAGAYVVVPGYIQNPTLAELVPVFFGVASVVTACGVVPLAGRAWARGARTAERDPECTPTRGRFATAEARA